MSEFNTIRILEGKGEIEQRGDSIWGVNNESTVLLTFAAESEVEAYAVG